MNSVDEVRIARRFQRSIRIDVDAKGSGSLDGFVCPKSSADALLQIAQHVKQGHCAFTWTGPYGTGKSSLAVALSAALNGDKELRKKAASVLGRSVVGPLWRSLPLKTRGWRVVPVIGKRSPAPQLIGDALAAHGYIDSRVRTWNSERVLNEISAIAKSHPRSHGGLLIIVDEMGKLLEGAALDGEDIFFLQELAELASRSNGRLLFVGILHQAFDEYAQQLVREQREEWAKIQGRFVDIPVNTVGDEQLALLSRAIESSPPRDLGECDAIAAILRQDRPHATKELAQTLRQCWPLHPVTACLLGPVSRRRFGQNQRSLFGFLNSAEPHGFQAFLACADSRAVFTPDKLWDYLRANLEPAILASPDGHRWSMAAEEVDACASRKGTPLHISLLKTIALVEMFKDHSGLSATPQLLATLAGANIQRRKVDAAIKQLQEWSFVIHRRHSDTYVIYAGSDFDINHAVDEEMQAHSTVDFAELAALAGLHPIVAKRHYHETGALRWFDFGLTSIGNLEAEAKKPSKSNAIGKFLLALPDNTSDRRQAAETCRKVVRMSDGNIVVGLPPATILVSHLAKEYLALQRVTKKPELQGDKVARREVSARLADMRARLENELRKAVNACEWYRKQARPMKYEYSELNILASGISDKRFECSPKVQNELLNRHQLSSNAVAAQKELLRHMVEYERHARLSIDGFPAEGGLYESILAKSGLHQRTSDGWQFTEPTQGNDPCNLLPIWQAATKLLQDAKDDQITVSRLYDVWQMPPFGVAKGLLPLLVVAYLLTEQRHLAFYRDGVFQPRFTALEVDHLVMDPSSIQLRWMDLSGLSERTLSGLVEAVHGVDEASEEVREPIEVARRLVGVYVGLPLWTKRTSSLSKSAREVRDLLKQAADPNKLLFDDIPRLVGVAQRDNPNKQADQIVDHITSALQEITQAYSRMLDNLKRHMLEELHVRRASHTAVESLRERATNILSMGGDFRLKAFIDRVSRFDNSREAMEGIAGLAANKPARDWVDTDLGQAKIEILDFARRFIRLEAFASVEGRPNKRDAMAIILGTNGRRPLIKDFTISETERTLVDAMAMELENVLSSANDPSSQVVLAALARVSAKYM